MLKVNKMKVLLVSVLSVLFCFSVAMAFNTNAYADGGFGSLTMDTGAYLKTVDNGGLRLRAVFDEDVKTALEDNDTNLFFKVMTKETFDSASGDFSGVKTQVQVDKSLIYTDGNGKYFANCLLDYSNVEGDIFGDTFCAVAYITDGVNTQYATIENESQVSKSLYGVVNSAVLDENVANTADILRIYNFFGSKDYPIVVKTNAEYEVLVNKINDGAIASEIRAKVDPTVNTEVAKLGEGKKIINVYTVKYMYNDIEIGSAEVECGNTVENDGIKGFSKTWQLNGGDTFDFNNTFIENDTTVYATGDINLDLSFNRDPYTSKLNDQNTTLSREKILDNDAFDLDIKNNETYLGISNPIGRLGNGRQVSCGNVDIYCLWHFNSLTSEIVNAYMALGCDKLTFKFAVQLTAGALNNCSLYFFGEMDKATVSNIVAEQIVEVNLDLKDLSSWLKSGSELFMTIRGFEKGTMARFAAGEFAFKFREKKTVKYKCNETVLGTTDVECVKSIKDEPIAGLSTNWKLGNEDYNINNLVIGDITLTTDELSYVFNFEGENLDVDKNPNAPSYELISGAKWDFKRSENTEHEIVRPVGRPDVNTIASTSMNGKNMVCCWKFVITTDIIDLFIEAGYKYLSFDVYLSASNYLSGTGSFLGEAIKNIEFKNNELNHFKVDIEAFKTWVGDGMTKSWSFMITPIYYGSGMLDVGNFEFTK